MFARPHSGVMNAEASAASAAVLLSAEPPTRKLQASEKARVVSAMELGDQKTKRAETNAYAPVHSPREFARCPLHCRSLSQGMADQVLKCSAARGGERPRRCEPAARGSRRRVRRDARPFVSKRAAVRSERRAGHHVDACR